MGVVSDTCCEHERDFREVWLPITMNSLKWLEVTIYIYIYNKIWKAVDGEVLKCKREKITDLIPLQ